MEDLALIREAFGRALEMPSGERQFLLAGLPAAVRSEVLSLLAAHQSAGTFLNTPEDGWRRNGERIGPYRIVEKIGHGGMGVVYRARRDDGEFRREVAIKRFRCEVLGQGLQCSTSGQL